MISDFVSIVVLAQGPIPQLKIEHKQLPLSTVEKDAIQHAIEDSFERYEKVFPSHAEGKEVKKKRDIKYKSIEKESDTTYTLKNFQYLEKSAAKKGSRPLLKGVASKLTYQNVTLFKKSRKIADYNLSLEDVTFTQFSKPLNLTATKIIFAEVKTKSPFRFFFSSPDISVSSPGIQEKIGQDVKNASVLFEVIADTRKNLLNLKSVKMKGANLWDFKLSASFKVEDLKSHLRSISLKEQGLLQLLTVSQLIRLNLEYKDLGYFKKNPAKLASVSQKTQSLLSSKFKFKQNKISKALNDFQKTKYLSVSVKAKVPLPFSAFLIFPPETLESMLNFKIKTKK